MKLGCGCNQQPLHGLGAAAPAWTQDPSLVIGRWVKADGQTFVVTRDMRGHEEATLGPGTFTPGRLVNNEFIPQAEGVAGETKPDIIAGVVAFGAPLAYEYGAPKKWPRLNWWQNVGAVVGLYFLSRFVYRKVTTPAP